jgi:hypothetical protein
MSQTSDEKNDESAKNAALKENISEDIQEKFVEEINSDTAQVSEESLSGHSNGAEDSLDEGLPANEADDPSKETGSTLETNGVAEQEVTEDKTVDLESRITADLALIREDLSRLNGKVEKLGNPSSTEISRAKNLIILLSAITGIVMIASITFFMVMSINVSQKITELDRVLLAVAKRGGQLGDGIEKISEMENKLSELVGLNESIPSSLEGIKSQILNQGTGLISKEEENFTFLRTRFDSIVSKQIDLERDIGDRFKKLELHVDKSVNLTPLTTADLDIKKQLEALNQDVIKIDRKLNDLYVIKQAEMEKVFLELQNGE